MVIRQVKITQLATKNLLLKMLCLSLDTITLVYI